MVSAQQFKTNSAVRMQIESTWTGLRNIVPNPTGEAGSWGWRAKVQASTFDVVAGPAFRVTRTGAFAPQISTDYLPLEKAWGPGSGDRWVKGSVRYVGGAAFQANVSFYDKSRNTVSSTTLTTSTSTPGVVALPAVAVPAGAYFATINIRHNTATVGSSLDFTDAVLVFGTQAAVTAATLVVEAPWIDILNPATSISIVREGLTLGTLTTVVRDSTLDPAIANTIRRGKRIRVQALSGAVWEYLFNGTVDTATVTYDLMAPVASKRARIEITAFDRNAALASIPRKSSYSAIAQLPDVLDNTGVPFKINGSTAGTWPATPVASDPNGTALSQVGITRDTAGGYAWMSRAGVLTAWDRGSIPATVVTTLAEATYTALDVGFDPADVINDVTIKTRSFESDGSVVETTFGPYSDEVSSLEWGKYHRDFTIAGSYTSAQAEAFAAAVFTNAAQPRVRVKALRFTVATTADIVAGRALLDLYDVVKVTNAAKAIDQNLRPTRIVHHIDPDKWTIDAAFVEATGIAAPMTQPSPRGTVFTPATNGLPDTAWTDLPLAAGWSQYDAASWRAQYRRKNGDVKVRGLIVNGTAPTSVMFTLPAGFRPLYNAIHPGMHSGNAATWLYVYANGQVQMPGVPGNPTWQSVSVSFQAEQ